MLPAGPQYWLRNRADGPRRVLVSGVSVDGSCSHALLESFIDKSTEVPVTTVDRPLGPFSEGLFALEATTPQGLQEKIAALKNFIRQRADQPVDRLAAEWLTAVPPLPQNQLCLALVAGSAQELTAQLEYAASALADNPDRSLGTNAHPAPLPAARDRVFYNPQPLAADGKVAFVFPGSGNHFAGMGRELSAQWPGIFARQDRHSEFLAAQYQPEQFWQQQLHESIFDDHNALVISHVALCTAISDLVRSFGIEPQAISGYSLGESRVVCFRQLARS